MICFELRTIEQPPNTDGQLHILYYSKCLTHSIKAALWRSNLFRLWPCRVDSKMLADDCVGRM